MRLRISHQHGPYIPLTLSSMHSYTDMYCRHTDRKVLPFFGGGGLQCQTVWLKIRHGH